MTVAPNKASSESNSNNLKKDDFPKTAPAAYPVFFRSYSRKTTSGKRENWSEVGERNLSGLKELGKLSEEELILMREMQSCLLYTSPSPRDFQVSRMPSSA